MSKYKIDIDNYSQRYINEHTKRFSFEALLAEIRRKQVIKSLSKHNHNHILEVGCGLEPIFKKYYNYKNYTVVEPSIKFVKNARKIAHQRNNIDIIHGFIEDVYKELRGRFNFIIVSSLIHEVPNYKKLLHSIYKLCGEDTVVHINVPNVYSFHRLLAYEMGYIESILEKSSTERKFQRHTRFNMELLIKAVTGSGFKVISSGTYFIKPFSNEQMEKIIKQGIINKNVIKGLEKMTEYMPDLGCEMFVDMRINA